MDREAAGIARRCRSPGSRVGIAIGEPFHVPPDVDDDGLERHRVELERRLATLERRAAELAEVVVPRRRR